MRQSDGGRHLQHRIAVLQRVPHRRRLDRVPVEQRHHRLRLLAQNALANLAVPLHDDPLFVAKRTGLQQHVVGNADLADVVQRRGQQQHLEERPRHPHCRRHRPAVTPHPNHVVSRVLIAELGRHAQPADDAHPRLSQIDALPLNFLVQQRIARPQIVLVTLRLQHAPQSGDQLTRVDRLVQQIDGAAQQRLLLQVRVVQSGQNHDRHVFGLVGLPDAFEQLDAGQPRHANVGDHRVVGRLQQRFPRLLRIADERHVPIAALMVQSATQGVQHPLVVVDNQNLLLHAASSKRASLSVGGDSRRRLSPFALRKQRFFRGAKGDDRRHIPCRPTAARERLRLPQSTHSLRAPHHFNPSLLAGGTEISVCGHNPYNSHRTTSTLACRSPGIEVPLPLWAKLI